MNHSVPDVCYWLNCYLNKHRSTRHISAINCAVEESSLIDREKELNSQDLFVQKHIIPNDILIVSVGGNDIALKPTAKINMHMGSLIVLSLSMIEWNPSFKFFINYFSKNIKKYIDRLTLIHKPRMIIVCGIYFPYMEKDGQISYFPY